MSEKSIRGASPGNSELNSFAPEKQDLRDDTTARQFPG